jgi:hypothetical protein
MDFITRKPLCGLQIFTTPNGTNLFFSTLESLLWSQRNGRDGKGGMEAWMDRIGWTAIHGWFLFDFMFLLFRMLSHIISRLWLSC